MFTTKKLVLIRLVRIISKNLLLHLDNWNYMIQYIYIYIYICYFLIHNTITLIFIHHVKKPFFIVEYLKKREKNGNKIYYYTCTKH